MSRLIELVNISAACQRAYESARTDGDHAAAVTLNAIGTQVAKLIGEVVIGDEANRTRAAGS